MMIRVQLIHWKADEAAERAERLRSMGYNVEHDERPISTATFRAMRADPPDVLVIDLSRLPMNGRDVALQVRMSPRTRAVPIVFVGGLPEKRERVREAVPGGLFTTWEEIGGVIEQAALCPPEVVRAPRSIMEVYHTKPLAVKFGIREGMSVAAIDAPDHFAELLGDLPEGARLVPGRGGSCDMAIWFVADAEELELGIDAVIGRIGAVALWLAWPKKGTRARTAISYHDISRAASERGYSQSKVCSVDDVWSAVRCTPARAARR